MCYVESMKKLYEKIFFKTNPDENGAFEGRTMKDVSE